MIYSQSPRLFPDRDILSGTFVSSHPAEERTALYSLPIDVEVFQAKIGLPLQR